MDYVTLNNGIKMPLLGFGCYLLRDEKQCEESVYNALMAGYRLIDTAVSYGNEEAVGRAIKRSGISREDLFITTKLWVQDYTDKRAIYACEHSLKRLGLDYLDLYLLHQPYGDVYNAWRAMENLYLVGKTRAIGVSNFYPDRLLDLTLHNRIKPMVNQIEINPFFQRYDEVTFMEKNGVQTEAWSPLATGRNNIFENEVLNALAKKYKRSVAQIALRWNIQRGIVTIAKAAQKEHMQENFQIFDFSISEGDMKILADMNTETSVYFGRQSHRDPKTVKTLGTMIFKT